MTLWDFGGLGVKWKGAIFLDNEGRPGQLWKIWKGYNVQGDTKSTSMCVSTLLNAVIF